VEALATGIAGTISMVIGVSESDVPGEYRVKFGLEL